jgi:hypothetical protein
MVGKRQVQVLLNEMSIDGISSVFDLLRDQLHTVFWMIPVFIQAKVSLDRVDDFLHNVGP